MVTAKAKLPVKRIRKPVAKKVVPKVSPAPSSKNPDAIGRVVDLIKWVDNPFKLLTVILLSFMFFAGYFAWDSRQVILQAITNSNHNSELKDTPSLMQVALAVQRDLEAETVTVHKASLVVNSRTTLFALNSKGHDKTMDGVNSSLFNKDPQRNQAMISMLGGEVYCDKLVVTGKNSDWEEKQGVKYVCRAGIPPQMGEFDGYISVGFREAPEDATEIKTRLNLASTEMSK
jgi:anthranilate/para-aminobenzoate synthase component II